MKELLQTGTFSDVTIVCDDKVAIAAHKFILRTCSQTFKDIVDTDSVIHISGVNHNELMTILAIPIAYLLVISLSTAH